MGGGVYFAPHQMHLQASQQAFLYRIDGSESESTLRNLGAYYEISY